MKILLKSQAKFLKITDNLKVLMVTAFTEVSGGWKSHKIDGLEVGLRDTLYICSKSKKRQGLLLLLSLLLRWRLR